MNGSEASLNLLEVETRFRILTDMPFSSVESRISERVNARKLRSYLPANDIYYDPTVGFVQSKTDKEFHRLRLHTVYENGIPTIRQTNQTKRLLEMDENKYGIESWLETQNHEVRDLNKEIGNLLTVGGYKFLSVRGDRNSYSTVFRGLPLEINFDTMLSPEGRFVEVGTEGEIDSNDVIYKAKNYSGIIADFIGNQMRTCFDELGIKTQVEPIYPLILLR